MNILKSTGAVVAGFLTVVVLSIGTDFILEWMGFLPSPSEPYSAVWWMLLIALIYRCAFTVAGGYVTARLAPNRPMRHVIMLACLGILGGVLGIFAGWHLGDHWYPIAIAVSAYPCTWLGGYIHQMYSKASAYYSYTKGQAQ